MAALAFLPRPLGTPIRNWGKRLVEHVLVASGVARSAQRRVQGRALILAYHNIVPRSQPAGGEQALHLPQDVFASHLDVLQDMLDIVPLDALLAAGTRAAPASRPRAAITFDDAYRGAVGAGVDELARRSLPATIFVAPGFVDGGTFWWDALADAGTLPDALRHEALTTAGGDDGAVRRWAAARGLSLRQTPSHATVASEAELQAAARHDGITLGSHSWSHPNLTRLAGPRLEEELRRPLEWLQARFSRVTSTLAYPYGLASVDVERAAAAAGYDAGLLIAGGWRRGDEHPFRVPRLNVPAGLSPNGLALRSAGLWCR